MLVFISTRKSNHSNVRRRAGLAGQVTVRNEARNSLKVGQALCVTCALSGDSREECLHAKYFCPAGVAQHTLHVRILLRNFAVPREIPHDPNPYFSRCSLVVVASRCLLRPPAELHDVTARGTSDISFLRPRLSQPKHRDLLAGIL